MEALIEFFGELARSLLIVVVLGMAFYFGVIYLVLPGIGWLFDRFSPPKQASPELIKELQAKGFHFKEWPDIPHDIPHCTLETDDTLTLKLEARLKGDDDE